MKLSIRLTVLASLCLYVQLFAQPNGTNYVRQSDFGDAQNTSSPNASSEWINLSFWNDVQTLSTQSDWFGPNYELDSSSHPHYVMLDDAPSDYGALAGQLIDLEYRLVEVNFDYLTYNERNTDLNTTDGKLHVLLCTSENDVRSFDPNNPSLFETGGFGQVLMTINFQGGPTNGLDLTAWNSTGSSSSRRAYALSKSQTGTPGNPFTYVGLVWESDFNETRLVLDNFRITDICPDCEMREPPRNSGCMDVLWRTPITNNYYYYSASIRDSASNALVFRDIHMPAPFEWDGVGNQGAYNGALIPYGQGLKANVVYYSCLRGATNIRDENYTLRRTAGCADSIFGGYRLMPAPKVKIWPNPISINESFFVEIPSPRGENATLSLIDIRGKTIQSIDSGLSEKDKSMIFEFIAPSSGLYFLSVFRNGKREVHKVLAQ